VQLATLKQRGEKATRGPGRAPSGVVPHRLVPLSDPQYVAQLERMVATHPSGATQSGYGEDREGQALDGDRQNGAY